MFCRLVGTAVVIMAVASPSVGLEVQATIQKVDVEHREIVVFANGKDRTVKVSPQAKIQDEDGKDLSGGLAAAELKAGTTVTLNVQRIGDAMAIVSIRLGRRPSPAQAQDRPARVSRSRTTVGFKPLTEMSAEDRYKGEDGGLYGGGHNELPAALNTAAERVTSNIVPRDASGQPATSGRIGLVSISMSNATQEFSRFKQLADRDPDKSPRVTVVDCAQGGQTMARWADPQAACWTEADRRLQAAGVSDQQVQVAWIKLANARPSGELHEHGKQLEKDTRIVLANLKQHFPNLRIAYLGSRIYGGYADGNLNPEPYAYEGAFVARWLIQAQMKGEADLNHDPDAGEIKSPLLLWGPYLWADGITPRKTDGLAWLRSDVVGDGTHPSTSGRQKVAEQLLDFFKTDRYARTWFVK